MRAILMISAAILALPVLHGCAPISAAKEISDLEHLGPLLDEKRREAEAILAREQSEQFSPGEPKANYESQLTFSTRLDSWARRTADGLDDLIDQMKQTIANNEASNNPFFAGAISRQKRTQFELQRLVRLYREIANVKEGHIRELKKFARESTS